MEEVVALLARSLEAHETEVFSRDNGLLTFAADDYGFEFHARLLRLLLLIPPLATLRFQSLWALCRRSRAGTAHAKSASVIRLSACTDPLRHKQPSSY